MRNLLPWFVLAIVVLGAVFSVLWRFRPRIVRPQFDPDAIRIEVLNGCCEPRLARAVADELQRRGYNVYSTGDAPSRCARTTIVDLRDTTASFARLIAQCLVADYRPRILDVPIGRAVQPVVRVELDSARYLEVRILLGEDWRKLFPGIMLLR